MNARWRKAARGAERALAVAGLFTVIVMATPVVRWWASALAGEWPAAKGGVLIVLGSDAQMGSVGEASYWRAFCASEVFRNGRWQQVIVTGGGGIAEAMRDFMMTRGVPGMLIRVENRSVSTRDNARFVAEMLVGDTRPKALLTSDYHMRRALACFRKAGVDAIPCPIPHALKREGLWWQRPGVFVELGAETVKLIYYGARGWI